MPILKPGQSLGDQANQAPELYGVNVPTNSLLFQERLSKKFGPSEYVEIKNVDSSPLYWQYMPIENERTESDETGKMQFVYRQDPELWGIAPGESEYLIGACAYRALDVLYKNVAARKAITTMKDPNDLRKAKNGEYAQVSFNFSDAGVQEDVIKQAYLGKVTPTFGRPTIESFQPEKQVETTEVSDGARNWPVPADTSAKSAKANAGTAR